MFEIGFLLLGRVSIYWICVVILVNSFGLLIIFFNTFGNIFKNVMTGLVWSDVAPDDANFGMKMECWVLALALFLLPSVFQKELAELKILSIALFIAALIFVFSNILELIVVGNNGRNPDNDYSQYGTPQGFNKEFV
jgi:amino acid permease